MFYLQPDWEGDKLIKMNWGANEDLLFVLENGNVYVCNMFGKFERQFSLGMVSCFLPLDFSPLLSHISYGISFAQ